MQLLRVFLGVRYSVGSPECSSGTRMDLQSVPLETLCMTEVPVSEKHGWAAPLTWQLICYFSLCFVFSSCLYLLYWLYHPSKAFWIKLLPVVLLLVQYTELYTSWTRFRTEALDRLFYPVMEPLFSALLFPEIIFIKFIKPGPDLSFIECSPFPDTHGH